MAESSSSVGVVAKAESSSKVAVAVAPKADSASKLEPAKLEPAKLEPAKLEPAKLEPAKLEPVKLEPPRVGAAKIPTPQKAEVPRLAVPRRAPGAPRFDMTLKTDQLRPHMPPAPPASPRVEPEREREIKRLDVDPPTEKDLRISVRPPAPELFALQPEPAQSIAQTFDRLLGSEVDYPASAR